MIPPASRVLIVAAGTDRTGAEMNGYRSRGRPWNCQIGAGYLSGERIFDWLEDTLER